MKISSREKPLTVTLQHQEGFLVIKRVMLFMWVTVYTVLQESSAV